MRDATLPAAQEHILTLEDGRDRLLAAVRDLSQAFALAVPHEEALGIRDDVAFFQAVRAALAKRAPGKAKTEEELLLRKLLSGEIRTRRRKNVVQARAFSEMLEQAIRRYQNRAVEAAQVIEELIALAKEMREADRRGEDLGLTEEELAFYDARETNDSAVKVLGRAHAADHRPGTGADGARANVTVDWTVRENVRVLLRVLVKRILRKYGYPPDKQAQATLTVLEQAETLAELWAAA